jgi:DNA uptake protein ComE-like DNA-binding protein/type II secretory pathway pseudopilin PulG
MKMRRRRGFILLLVLVVITMLALASLGFSNLMLNERRAAQTSGRQAQARAFAQSGVEVAKKFLDRTPTDQTDAGGLYDNSQRFANQLVVDDDSPRERGRFSIIAPRIEDRTVTGIRYGLQDESARINLATILTLGGKDDAKTMLMGLPSMTDDVADAILDWIDADDTPREQGAEVDYYGSLTPAYAPRNAPPVTIEELLLVRGVTPELLFGSDAARMGLIGPNSENTSATGVDNTDGQMDHGWAAYLTLWSAESTSKPDGTKKINLNDSDLKKLYDSLVEALDQPSAEFIVAYRLGGSGQADSTRHLDISNLGKGSTSLKSLLDLVDAKATLKPQATKGSNKSQSAISVKNPFTKDSGAMSTYLPKLHDNCTTSTAKSIRGRININQASRVVLTCIPGMTTDLADKIIANRTPDPTSPSAPANRQYPTWPLMEGVIDFDLMKKLEPFITAGGSVYRAQVLGTFDKGSPSARLEILPRSYYSGKM